MAEATTEKHKSGLINTNFTTNYNCDACDFVCNNKSDYERHTKTNKHKRHSSVVPAVSNKKMSDIENSLQQFMNEIVKSNQEIVKELVKSNQELQQQVVELSTKQPIQQITNIQNTQNN
jgi:hypothetical protein